MYSFILNIINKLTPNPDKLAHFYWGFVYGIISFFIGYYLLDSLIFILFLPLVLGVLKEYIDSKGKGDSEFMDIVFTVLPSLIILIILIITKNGF